MTISGEIMTKDERLEKLRMQIASAVEKDKRLDELLHNCKKEPERGDIYLFDLDAIPKDVAVFWVILHRHPKDPNLFFTVPADTNPLKGVFDVSIPSMALFGFLVLRLGQGIWLPDFVFNPPQRVGMVETLFIDRAQFIMSRIAKNEWIGNDMQQATEANPDYEEWTEMLNNIHAGMMNELEKQLVLKHDKAVAQFVLWQKIARELLKNSLTKEALTKLLLLATVRQRSQILSDSRTRTSLDKSTNVHQCKEGDDFEWALKNVPGDGCLVIYDFKDDDLCFIDTAEAKKVVRYTARLPLGKHNLKALWTAKSLFEVSDEGTTDEAAMKIIADNFITRLEKINKDAQHDIIYYECEYEVVEPQ